MRLCATWSLSVCVCVCSDVGVLGGALGAASPLMCADSCADAVTGTWNRPRGCRCFSQGTQEPEVRELLPERTGSWTAAGTVQQRET